MSKNIHDFIPLSELKHFLRVTTSIDDALLKQLLETAQFFVENYTSQAIIKRIYTQEIFSFNKEIKLSNTPVIQVKSILDNQGNEVNYQFKDEILTILNRPTEKMTVQYVAGLFDITIPSHFKIALMQIVAQLYNGENENQLLSTLSKFNLNKQYKI